MVVLGRYRIDSILGTGGMGLVVRATHIYMAQPVAIKFLRKDMVEDTGVVQRFLREAHATVRLRGDHIARVIDVGMLPDGTPFMVMEFLEGSDLNQILRHHGAQPPALVVDMLLQACEGIAEAHALGIVHRDLKPSNFFVTRKLDGSPLLKILDFGISKAPAGFDSELTKTQAVVGTPSYMSPEQILGDRLDARSDIFSLGIVLYQMVTGRKPFVEDEEKSVMHKIRLERHVRARKLNPELPREVDRIIDKCLQKEPRNRFQSGQALVMALERFLGKHVEMNYQARLVLYLRNQDVITKLEADEYLNPAIAGSGGATAGPQNLTARRMVRRGLVVQAVIVGVVAFMVGLIHLAPVGATGPAASTVIVAPERRGYVRVVVNPWGRISIDGQERGVTPIAAPIPVTAGLHKITIENDYFETFTREVDVPVAPEEEPIDFIVDLEADATAKGGGQ